MTREEAIKRLRGILTEAVEFENSVCYVTEENREPLEMAIEALERKPSDNATLKEIFCMGCEYIEALENQKSLEKELEKIRQEIYDIEEPDHDFEGFYYCFEEALKIIDKELAEMKGENK